jgi:hypothetical protein
MEEKVRDILKSTVEHDPPRTLADLALEIFGTKGGVELELSPRAETREPPCFDSTDFDPQ